MPADLDSGPIPKPADLLGTKPPPGLITGGEDAACRRLTHWLRSGLDAYDANADDLAADGTSRLSADLHFGCLSPREVADRAGEAPPPPSRPATCRSRRSSPRLTPFPGDLGLRSRL